MNVPIHCIHPQKMICTHQSASCGRMRRNCGYRADSSCDGSGSAPAHSGRFPCGWVVCGINGKLTVNNPFTVAIQLSESNIGFVPTALLFTIHWTRKAEMSGSVRKIFWKAFHFTTDISSSKRRYRNERFSKNMRPCFCESGSASYLRI